MSHAYASSQAPFLTYAKPPPFVIGIFSSGQLLS